MATSVDGAPGDEAMTHAVHDLCPWYVIPSSLLQNQVDQVASASSATIAEQILVWRDANRKEPELPDGHSGASPAASASGDEEWEASGPKAVAEEDETQKKTYPTARHCRGNRGGKKAKQANARASTHRVQWPPLQGFAACVGSWADPQGALGIVMFSL
mmetsp:Transcript_18537/g.60242  ORF Transcript_18537/g.60242 Transcript_18537/m.60242 type:complete len:159 (+) Transcript_18537:87-563(+)